MLLCLICSEGIWQVVMKTVEVKNIRKEYGILVAVDDANFCVERGQVLGLIGPNGAGKTTLLRILATVLRPTSGSAQLLGHDLAKEYLEIRKDIGFLPDFFNLYNDLTLAECLEFFGRAYNVAKDVILKRVDEVLEYVDLTDKRNSLIKHLSRGMVQRMGVGILLVHEPEVLILDEPASGLDPKARIELRRVLKRLSAKGKTVIISSHILTELSGFCSHIAIMDKGNIEMFGAVEEIERKIGGARKVKVSVLDKCDEAVGLIKEWGQGQVVSTDGNMITVEAGNDVEQIAALNSYLVKQGVKVVSFYEEKIGLEDLFMKISGR